MWINQYWNSTRTPLYSFLFTVPLFFIYEIGIFLTSSIDMIYMRNGADALMRQILSAFESWLYMYILPRPKKWHNEYRP